MTRKIHIPWPLFLCVQIGFAFSASPALFAVTFNVLQDGFDGAIQIVITVWSIFGSEVALLVLLNVLLWNAPLTLSSEGIRRRNKLYRWDEAISVRYRSHRMLATTLNIKYSNGRSISIEIWKSYLKSIEDACNNRQFLVMFWTAMKDYEDAA